MDIRHVLVVLADDAGHRALPVRLPGHGKLWRLLSRPDDLHEEDLLGAHAEEMTGRLLQAAGVTLAGVTVTDLGPGVTATRIGIAGPGGTRPVTASLADGLTLAVITGAPLAVDEPVMDRLARPVTGPELLSQFRSQQTSPRSLRRRFEPRNMAFTDGLDRWELGGTFLRQGTGFDYSATTEDGRAILAAAVPEPAGFAFLAQDIERRRLPRPHRHLPRRTAHRQGGRPRRAGAPRQQRGPVHATPGSQPRSPGRPGHPHRLRHRDRRVDPVRGHRPDPGGRQPDQVRRLPERRRPGRIPPPGTCASSARPAITPPDQDSP